MVFRLFRETGTAFAVMQRFAEGALRFPKRSYGGAWDGRIIWGRLTHNRVLTMLKNPSYAARMTCTAREGGNITRVKNVTEGVGSTGSFASRHTSPRKQGLPGRPPERPEHVDGADIRNVQRHFVLSRSKHLFKRRKHVQRRHHCERKRDSLCADRTTLFFRRGVHGPAHHGTRLQGTERQRQRLPRKRSDWHADWHAFRLLFRARGVSLTEDPFSERSATLAAGTRTENHRSYRTATRVRDQRTRRVLRSHKRLSLYVRMRFSSVKVRAPETISRTGSKQSRNWLLKRKSPLTNR